MRMLAAALAALFMLAFGDSRAAEPPKDPPAFGVGAILAMTGQASSIGQTMSQGMLQAVDEINAKGGVDGIKLEADIEDHKGGGGQDGVAAMNRLISIHHVQAVLTSFSAPTIAIAPIADQQHVLLVNGGAVSAKLVGLSPYLFSSRSLATDLSRVAIAHAREIGAKKLAQMQWQNDVGDNIVKLADQVWRDGGGSIVASEAVAQGATNMDTQIAKVRAANPEVIALWMFTPETGLALKRIRDFGMKQPIIGVEYTDNDANIAGPAAEGYYFANDFSCRRTTIPGPRPSPPTTRSATAPIPTSTRRTTMRAPTSSPNASSAPAPRAASIGTATRCARRCSRTRNLPASMAGRWYSNKTASPSNAPPSSPSRTASASSSSSSRRRSNLSIVMADAPPHPVPLPRGIPLRKEVGRGLEM
jgi:branched-chain amino acid transport system substrate-binding protein